MPKVVRFQDSSTGHPCWPPRPNDQASTDVFANSIGVHRLGDHWPIHCCPPGCHDGLQSTASPNVFVNNKGVARVGDNISCGDFNRDGSPNVYAN